MYSLEKLKSKLRPGHVLHTLISEHEFIFGFLSKLELLNDAIQKNSADPAKAAEISELKNVAEHLIGAEPHHKREEDVLFPEMEARDVFGPPSVMRQEHEELRAKKKELKDLVDNADTAGLSKEKLQEISRYLVPTLKEHIDKENNILYPLAFEVIKEKSVWTDMKNHCDKIGYCCFTPEV